MSKKSGQRTYGERGMKRSAEQMWHIAMTIKKLIDITKLKMYKMF